MAATVVSGFSNEVAQWQPPTYAPLKPNLYEGRLRHAFFSKTFNNEAAGANIALCTIPKGARIVAGEFCFSASTGTATIAIGIMDKGGSGFIDAANSVSDNTAFFLAAAAVTVTTMQGFANTQALNYGYETEKEDYLTLTTAVAAMTTQVLKGRVTYIVD